MNTQIKNTLTYKLVEQQARELSTKTTNTIYVIYRNKSLITSLIQEEGQLLSTFFLGSEINN